MVVTKNDEPILCLFAIRDIIPGEEILYDYGEANYPWENEVNVLCCYNNSGTWVLCMVYWNSAATEFKCGVVVFSHFKNKCISALSLGKL